MNPATAPKLERPAAPASLAPAPSPQRRSNFGVAFALLPREQREAIRAVHAWSRAVDDAVDEEPDHRLAGERIAHWRRDLAALYDGSPTEPVTLGLRRHVARYEIPRGYFDELLSGVEMDLTRDRYASFAELERYCYRVAAVVGLICLRIFGDREERGRAYAESLGTALQLTNIVRDVAGDFARGRIYLPADEIARYGYNEEALARGERNAAFQRLMRHQAARARLYFDAAAAEARSLDRRRFIAAEIMGRVYRRLLEKIESSGFDVFHREIRVRRVERVWIAASTALTLPFSR